jgi:hypothetical protein
MKQFVEITGDDITVEVTILTMCGKTSDKMITATISIYGSIYGLGADGGFFIIDQFETKGRVRDSKYPYTINKKLPKTPGIIGIKVCADVDDDVLFDAKFKLIIASDRMEVSTNMMIIEVD